MSKMYVSNYTLCFIGKIYFITLQSYKLFSIVADIFSKIFIFAAEKEIIKKVISDY